MAKCKRKETEQLTMSELAKMSRDELISRLIVCSMELHIAKAAIKRLSEPNEEMNNTCSTGTPLGV